MNTAQPSPSPWQLTPVGEVRSPIKTTMPPPAKDGGDDTARLEKIRLYHEEVQNAVCELVIYAPWVELLDGIEGFSHILVLYWPHLLDPQRRNQRKVHPMGRKDLPLQGVFATCSPARPNPVLVSAVPLLERVGNILKVKGLEAVDGSPLIDIKPYNPSSYRISDPILPAWMIQLHREVGVDLTLK